MTRDDLTDQTGSNCSTSVHVRTATISKRGFQVDAEKQSNGHDTLKHCITKECVCGCSVRRGEEELSGVTCME